MEGFQGIIDNIKDAPEITLCVIALFLLIGAITKGGISLGFIEIPEIGNGQSKLLGGLGGSLLLLALFLFFNRPPKIGNIAPVADDLDRKVKKGEVLKIPILNNIIDEDNAAGALKVSIIKNASVGTDDLINDTITYSSNTIGKDSIIYQAIDEAGGKDSGVIRITVNPPEAEIVPRYGKLTTIYDPQIDGEYTTSLPNVKNSSTENKITARDNGHFTLNTDKEDELCKIYIEENNQDEFAKFYLHNENSSTQPNLVEYDPLKPHENGIKVIFCSYYENRIPVDTFSRNNIPFSKLAKEQVEEWEYGVLHLGLRFYGTNTIEKRGKLIYHFKRKDGDMIEYDPFPITSGSIASNNNGWRSNLSKKLLPGKYELTVKSQNGTPLKTIDFSINN